MLPERSLDQDCHKPHQDPFVIVACFSQASGERASSGFKKCFVFLFVGGLIRLWMWPLLLNTKSFFPPKARADS